MKSILQVFSFDMLSKILIGIIGIFLIRYMEASEYALYTFSLSIINIVAQTLSNTFRRIYIVGYDNQFKGKQIDSFIGAQLLIIFCFAIGLLMFTHKIDIIDFLIINTIIGITFLEFTKTIFQRELNFKQFSKIEIARSLSFFSLTIILIFTIQYNLRAWQVLLIQSSTMILITVTILWKKIKVKNLMKFKEYIQIGKDIVRGPYKYLIFYVLFSTILSQLDVLMLKYLSNNYQLATYGSAFRYYSLLLLALSSVNSVFLPVIQNIKNRYELDTIYSKHNKMLIVFIPIVLLGAWLANWVLPIIDMGKYPDAVSVFQILSFSAIFSFVFSPHTNFVMKFEDFKFLFCMIIIAVIVNCILNFIMIPLYGSIGAALATLIAFGFSNYMTYLRAQRHRKSLPIS
ncbi:oligosaccharide flippase family protein [Neobacillus drentensis]|uniref:oligosaccharide flippase family protein n=1 Tax=Neobacillus drentensis TaxID=220684 RepID=UPI002858DB33|nr:polysaccharide biosynthesis C-terminal domain-containing protein [Neobacillus drentensis]MDR7238767.1 O-antigen/teichoic acid export membrane protein [Neobacillus drentensis]